MDANVAKIYYSPQGYWKGPTAIKKLAQAAKVSEDAAKKINQGWSGWSIKPYGKYTFQLQSTFLAPNLICPPWMHFTKQAFSFYDDNQERGQGQNCWYCRIFQRSWTVDLERLCFGYEHFSKNLQMRSFETATAASGSPYGKT